MLRISPLLAAVIGVSLACPPAPAADKEPSSGVKVDKEKRTVTVDCKVAPRIINDPRYQKPDGTPYAIEVIACWQFPKGQKAHETVVIIDIKPSEVHKALESLGLKPGEPVAVEGKTPVGPKVNVYLELPGADGQPKKVPIEKILIDPKSGKPMPKVEWRFTGSVLSKPDPNKDETVYGADVTGTLSAILPVTNQTV